MIYVVNYCLIDVYSYPFSMPFVFIFLKALWDKALEFRFLLQKAFSSSHRIMDCHRLYLRRTRPLSKQQMVNLDDLGCHSHLRTLMVMRIGHRFLSCCRETSFYSLKKLHAKKRKIVDRRASNSRKIRYNVYEKIVNFMAPETMVVSPMLPDLNNLFGLKKQKPASVVQ
ncbi:uncharacterized protein LOC125469504 isoform X1 [Pyrus x bretschneideri]|uniref:uncharacterized protein LOC125469504 isoform X1 n=1 Tax=Pyrus x bretschneideri TaxID=225117 RepID=UPI00202DD283|nr:uncharacterized protein LOC125469504 isoform X1 [Pyrus x bretschneideri]